MTFGAAGLSLLAARLVSAQDAWRAPAGARFLKTMPLGRFDRRPAPPMHVLFGTGLDARQFTDLSELGPDRLLIPTERFFVRTSVPPSLPASASWSIGITGTSTRDTLAIAALRAEARPMGTHLMECSGNADPANFGLLSAATWDGVPMTAVLDRLAPAVEAGRVRVTGIDEGQPGSRSSLAGASWVFSRDELSRTGAFLATGMNGAPLTPHHGAPVRLVVPNYYGCSGIKWVSRIDWVGDDEPATLQMQEFAARTHQQGVPRLARDYEPPAIEVAAMPIRVERWGEPDGRGGERHFYRVIGVRWGGSAPRVPLTIRFRHREPFVAVDDCPESPAVTSWTLWSHTWRPSEPGRYQIALQSADRSVPARRLDLFYYTREVEIG